MENSPLKKKPRFFAAMGWSWAILGLLGILVGLIGLLSLPSFLHMKSSILETGEGLPPEMAEIFLPIFQMWIPSLIAKIVGSVFILLASLAFLKSKRWGYLALVWTNNILMLMCVGGYFFLIEGMRSAIYKLRATGFIETIGIDLQPPSYGNPLTWALLILLLIPFVLTTVYFFWKPVREYFAARPSET